MPSKDQIPKASLVAINKGDTNTQIGGSILGGDSPTFIYWGGILRLS